MQELKNHILATGVPNVSDTEWNDTSYGSPNSKKYATR